MLSGKFHLTLFCIAGIMTGIAHLFQIMTDKTSDIKNDIQTSVVALPGWNFIPGMFVHHIRCFIVL